MKKLLFLLFFVAMINFDGISQNFNSAYQMNPNIPRGMLEGLAWSRTRMHVMQGETEHESCAGLPHISGLFGLVDDGHNYFLRNMKTVSIESGYSIEVIKANSDIEILAVAKTLSKYFYELPSDPSRTLEKSIHEVLVRFSELPGNNPVQQYSRDVQSWEVLKFMNDNLQQEQFGFSQPAFNLLSVYGDNLQVLEAKRLIMNEEKIRTQRGYVYKPSMILKSTQYGPAIWNPAPSCNYSSRGGTAISAITIHTIQGSYSSAINWSQNCASNVSFHYVIRSSDGQVTQMCLESTKAWHVGSENPYTIGYEHEGFVAQTGWYTTAMYNSSAALTRDIIASGYGINGLRTYDGPPVVDIETLGSCIRIKGHQHYPNQSHNDPGINWDWARYYKLVNNTYTPTIITNAGAFTDNGGAGGNYTNDQRAFYLFQPIGATTVTLAFTSFATENGYDKMYIYNGNDITDPLIGVYQGNTNPGTIVSTGGSLLVEFRADCASTALGWNSTMSFTTTGGGGGTDLVAPTTLISPLTSWITQPVNVTYTDADNASTVANRLHLAADRTVATAAWTSNPAKRFMYEQFETADTWTNQTGTFTNVAGMKAMTTVTEENSNMWYPFVHNGAESYLYNWTQKFDAAGTNKRAGLHFFCSDPTLPQRGNSYLAIYRETQDIVELYKTTNDVLASVATASVVVPSGVNFDCKVFYNPLNGKIIIYLNNQVALTYTDSSPLTTGGSVSFRSGGCSISYDNFQVYHGRAATATLGLGASGHFRNQGLDVGIIKSLVIDGANNISSSDQEILDIDWTSASPISVNDGAGVDLDNTNSATWAGNWTATDVHSGMASYEYALGTTAGAINTIPWTATTATSFTANLTGSLVVGQNYFLSVKTINNAGLDSIVTSDGMIYTGVVSNNDIIAPTTVVAPINNWVTASVAANFTDTDNISGNLSKLFLVSDRVSINDPWLSNTYKGFMHEEFTGPDIWATNAGTWVTTFGAKKQTDENIFNSNISYDFVQSGTLGYLYQWSQNIQGAGTSRRAGLHFFCSDVTLPNRGNSYLVIYRDNSDVVELFKSTNDVLTLLSSVSANVPNDFWIDCKVYYNPVTGLINAYLNDVLLLSYTDANPITSGSDVSLRNGGSIASFDNFKVYHSRGNSEVLLAGPNEHFREQGIETGIIQSIVIDAANNISQNDFELVDVDFTAPINLEVNDGNGTDLDATSNPIWEGNWAAEDLHSNVVNFQYAVGTTIGAFNIIPWTATTVGGFTQDLSNLLQYNQMYYISLKAVNGAGLESTINSDGMLYLGSSVGLNELSDNEISIYPNPTVDDITLSVEGNWNVFIYDLLGKQVLKTDLKNGSKISVSELSAGKYVVLITDNQRIIKKEFVKR